MKLKATGIIYLAVFLLIFNASVTGQTRSNGTSIRNNAGYTHKSSNGLVSTELEYRGTIEFNESETDVKYISRGGFIKISQKTFGTRRTALLEGKSDGSINRTFFVGSREQPWNPEGAEWLADVLLDVIRSSGLGAESRVARFYKNGGIEAILDEIDEISSDYVKSIYFTHAVSIEGLSVQNMNKLIEAASEEISSDFELSSFYIKNSDIFVKNASSVTAVLRSTQEISSDFEQARVLKHYIASERLSDVQISEVVSASNEISSDFEHAGVLLALMQKNSFSENNLTSVLASIEDLSSDFEASRVLKEIIRNQNLTSSSISKIISASNSISSDFEQSQVLKSLINKDLNQENLMMVAEATENISSDFEKSGVLTSILSRNNFKENDLSTIIKASENISSDFEHAKVLNNIIKNGKLSDENFKAIIDACSEISSSFEKARVLKALINENVLTRQKSLNLLNAVKEVSSSFEKTGILIDMGPKLPDDEEVQNAFRETARTITSDYDYGRVMRSVDF